MALQVQDALRHVDHVLFSAHSENVDPIALVNRALSHCCSAYEWNWLIRPPVDLDFVAGQTWVVLPTDFSRELSVLPATTTRSVKPSTLANIGLLRNNSGSDGVIHWAISWANTGGGALLPRMEIYATPTASETGALQLIYRAGPAWLTDDQGYISGPNGILPAFMEQLYLDTLEAFALGTEKNHEAGISERLQKLAPMYGAMIRRDATTQGEYGIMGGGGHGGYEGGISPYGLSYIP